MGRMYINRQIDRHVKRDGDRESLCERKEGREGERYPKT